MSHDVSHTADPKASQGDSHADHGHGGHGGAGHGHGDNGHAHGTGVYWMVFLVLLVLLVFTVLVAYKNMGIFNVPVAYGIASLKAALILWYFMHLQQSTRLVQIFGVASFAWLAFMLLITLGDYFSRTLIPRAEVGTHIRRVDSWNVNAGNRQTALPGAYPHHDAGQEHAEKKDHPATKPAEAK